MLLPAQIFPVFYAGATAQRALACPPHVIGAIFSITLRNTTANAVTGGIKIGSSPGGTQVVSSIAVGANALVTVPDLSFIIRAPRLFVTGDVSIYFDAVTDWNGASLNISLYVYEFVSTRTPAP